MNAFELDAFQSGAFQEEVAAGSFAFQPCAFQDDAFQVDLCQVEPETPVISPAVGGKPRYVSARKWYEIDGKRYFLTEQELAVMVQALLQKYRLKEAKKAKIKAPPKPETVSAQEWAKVSGLLIELEALTNPIIETTVIESVKKNVNRIKDDELILMMML